MFEDALTRWVEFGDLIISNVTFVGNKTTNNPFQGQTDAVNTVVDERHQNRNSETHQSIHSLKFMEALETTEHDSLWGI